MSGKSGVSSGDQPRLPVFLTEVSSSALRLPALSLQCCDLQEMLWDTLFGVEIL